MAIRIKSATEHRIPIQTETEPGVWETTGYLVFDISDTGLTSRLFQMYEAIDRLTAQAEIDAKAIDERPDEPFKTIDVPGEDGPRTLLTKNQYDGAQMVDKFYTDARAALDKFLGEGACQKIFGDKNYSDMFSDLLAALQPEFEKMGLDAERIKHTAAEKHKPNRAQKRALK